MRQHPIAKAHPTAKAPTIFRQAQSHLKIFPEQYCRSQQ
jgi:hypothetical protein